MKIFLVGDYLNDPRLGSAKVPLKLAEEFRALGHKCDLLFAEDLGPRPRGMHQRQFVSPWLVERAINRAFARNGFYDVVDIASGEGALFGLKRLLGRFRNTAFISRSHGIEHLNYRRMVEDHRHGLLHKPWTRRIWYPAIRLNQVATAARTADRLVVLNQGDCDFVLKRGWKKQSQIDVIGHGISKRFLQDVPKIDAPRGRGILFCGTWTGMKGVDYLAPAFSRLIDSGVRVNLTILGGAVPAETIRAAFPAHVHPFLTIMDRVSEEEVIEHYRRHDVLVFPSTYEGYGMVLMEAMSQRLPCIATPVGCATTLVRNEQTGLMVPPRNSAALADALAHLLNDKPLREQLAMQAYQVVRDMTWTVTARRTLATYQQACDALVNRPLKIEQPDP
jgi:glycosyltransferase involved in cell wall biosynthesis